MNIQEKIELIKELFPNTRTEAVTMALGSLLGFVSAACGGFDNALTMLTVLVALDYLTGFAASLKTGRAGSKKGFIGAARKIAIFFVVSFSYILDGAMQINMLRSMVIFAYAANEGLSIIENVDKLGYGHLIPEFLKDKVEQLRKEKTGKVI